MYTYARFWRGGCYWSIHCVLAALWTTGMLGLAPGSIHASELTAVTAQSPSRSRPTSASTP